MSEIWLTSDLHLMHSQPFLYEPRGFTSTEEMCEAIVERWNSVVKPDDTVYNLGDMAMNDVAGAIPYLQRLNGIQIWIFGNHDTINKIALIQENCPHIIRVGDYHCSYATIIKNGKWSFYLSHYPTKVGNYDDEKIHSKLFALAGHTHTKDKFLDMKDKCYHVEMDAHDCYPVNIETVIADIRNYRNEIGQLPVPMQPEDI